MSENTTGVCFTTLIEALESEDVHVHVADGTVFALVESMKTGNLDDCRRHIELGGSDICHCKDWNGNSPIILASRMGLVDVVELLLSKGADVNDTDNDGRSSIMWACREANVDTVKLLLALGANIHKKDNAGHTCFSLACMSSKFKYVQAVHFVLRKWPTTMALIFFQKLGVYHLIDCSSLIDLHQYVGTENFITDDAYRED